MKQISLIISQVVNISSSNGLVPSGTNQPIISMEEAGLTWHPTYACCHDGITSHTESNRNLAKIQFSHFLFLSIQIYPSEIFVEHNSMKAGVCTKSHSSPPGQNDCHFAGAIFKCIFMNGRFCIFIQITLKFVPKGQIDNRPALVQVMAWRRTGDKPLPGSMVTQFINAYMLHQGEMSSGLVLKLGAISELRFCYFQCLQTDF